MGNKLYFAIFLTILVIPFTLADISLTANLKEKYNLGDPIKSSFDINPDKDIDGLFKLTLFCDSFEIDYFVTLVDMQQGQKIIIAPPELKPTARMKGNCKLKASLESLSKESLSQSESTGFEIVDTLDITVNLDEGLFLPGKTISMDGEIGSTHDNAEFSAISTFDGNEEELSVTDGKFTGQLILPNNIRSGNHILFVEAMDSFGNSGDKSIDIMIEPKIFKIGIELNKRLFKPRETIEIRPILYDQADEAVLDKSVSIQLSKGSDNLFSENIKSDGKAEYVFLRYAKPGDYVVKAVHDSLETEEIVTIEEFKELDMRLEGEIAYIKNIGNVKYNDVVNLNLFGEEKTYVLKKRVRLDPDESMSIDLSREVSTDNYQIEATIDDKNITISSDTPIEDKRSFFNRITGGVIAVGNGLLTGNPVAAGIIFFLIIASTVLFFVKKRKKNKF